MGVRTDEARGKAKQAIGAVTGNEKLQRDGRRDERTGRAKEKVDGAIDNVRDKLEDAADALHPNEKER